MVIMYFETCTMYHNNAEPKNFRHAVPRGVGYMLQSSRSLLDTLTAYSQSDAVNTKPPLLSRIAVGMNKQEDLRKSQALSRSPDVLCTTAHTRTPLLRRTECAVLKIIRAGLVEMWPLCHHYHPLTWNATKYPLPKERR